MLLEPKASPVAVQTLVVVGVEDVGDQVFRRGIACVDGCRPPGASLQAQLGVEIIVVIHLTASLKRELILREPVELSVRVVSVPVCHVVSSEAGNLIEDVSRAVLGLRNGVVVGRKDGGIACKRCAGKTSHRTEAGKPGALADRSRDFVMRRPPARGLPSAFPRGRRSRYSLRGAPRRRTPTLAVRAPLDLRHSVRKVFSFTSARRRR